MPKFAVTFACMAPVYAEANIEAETLDDAKRILQEMSSDDMPDNGEFVLNPDNVDRRDI